MQLQREFENGIRKECSDEVKNDNFLNACFSKSQEGFISGSLSVFGYRFLSPRLDRYFHDSGGLNNVHGMPALLGSIALAIGSALASFETYGQSLYLIFPARAPELYPPPTYTVLYAGSFIVSNGRARTALVQGAYQIAAFAITLAISICGGAVTGNFRR
ncbi:unnamed protein product [Protopolystoma xenopodis]|uniref:Ammonium transporter AmtB-like domain-containing protein n=1 Tax=Protopolystoma xenopodis TaxID=117903 RepID=A0A448XF30_9PLAT|nr:unnamed protein product [Protopolystoma xenopodis]